MTPPHIPLATEDESKILDHIDRLTAAAEQSSDDAPDIFEEALDAERLLADTRSATWLSWAHKIGLFDIYERR